jgi:hypothetical protein
LQQSAVITHLFDEHEIPVKLAHENEPLPPLKKPPINSIQSDAAALDALSALLLRRHLAAAVGASCAAVALRLAARLCSQQAPALPGATAVDVAIALARLVEVVPHVSR